GGNYANLMRLPAGRQEYCELGGQCELGMRIPLIVNNANLMLLSSLPLIRACLSVGREIKRG
ncbi:MAG TPA: hypothetical protein VKO42_01185, partial [Patescibacteria group bacterium]|nr:hypothetical protein [Patescibacteria group bacterium]